MKNLPRTLIQFVLTTSVFTSSNLIAGTETSAWNWAFTNSACGSSNDSICNGDTISSNGDSWTQNTTTGTGPNTTVAGWSSTGDVSGADTIQTARLQHYGDSGFGVVNNEETVGSYPGHAFGDSAATTVDTFDNMDSVVFHFGDTVTLTDINIGWYGKNNTDGYDAGTEIDNSDSDFSLLAWIGSSAGPGSLDGKTYASLLGAGGWELVGHYYFDENNSSSNSDDASIIPSSGGDLNFAVNSQKVSSSYYLLSVLNPELNACSGSSASRFCASNSEANNDFFKLHSIAGYTTTTTSSGNPSIPVPPTALLFLAALPLIRLTQRTKAA